MMLYNLAAAAAQGLALMRRSLRDWRTAIAVTVTLAFGIGAALFALSAFWAARFAPLAYPNGERLVRLVFDHREPRGQWEALGEREAATEVLSRLSSLEHAGLARTKSVAMMLGPDDSVSLQQVAITAEALDALGVVPVRGRRLTAADEQLSQPIVMISHGLWRSRFGSDNGVLGRYVSIDGETREVVGVLPRGFDYPDAADVLVPLRIAAPLADSCCYYVVGLLSAGVPLERAEQELEGITRQLLAEGVVGRLRVRLTPLRELYDDNPAMRVAPAVLALGMAVFVMALLNATMVQFARTVRRFPELAVRAALGATRGRLGLMAASEALFLSFGGALGGICLTAVGIQVARWRLGTDFPSWFPLSIGVLAAVGALALALATSVVAGGVPVMWAVRRDLTSWLQEGAANLVSGRRHRTWSRRLVAAQMMLAIAFTAATAEFVFDLVERSRRPLGFDPQGLALLVLNPRPVRARSSSAIDLTAVRALTRQQLGTDAFAVVQSVTLYRLAAVSAPQTGQVLGSLEVRDAPRVIFGDFRYQEVLDINLKAGRPLSASDAGQSVALLNGTAALRLFGMRSPIGQLISLDSAGPRQLLEVVGVIDDVRDRVAASSVPPPMVVTPVRSSLPLSVSVYVRGAGRELVRLQKQLASRYPGLDVRTPQLMPEVLHNQLRSLRIPIYVAGPIAVTAILLAMVGIHAFVSRAVVERSREFAIRKACGARASAIATQVLREMVGITAFGAVVGIPVAFALITSLSRLGWHVSPARTALAIGAAVTIGAVTALVACAMPTKRACLVEPAAALRNS